MSDPADLELFASIKPVAAPDLVEPVFAFRDWRIDADGLVSLRAPTRWGTRVVKADCRPQVAEDFVRPPHRAPGHDCSCGIHAYFTPSLETSKIDFAGVTGIVTVSGTVEVHRTGVRAEQARVEALGIYGPWARRKKEAVRRISGELGIDLVDVQDLAHAARSYGAPMPPALIPASPRAPVFGRRPPQPVGRRLVIVPA